MKNHPYVRAYLAGIAVPTVLLLAGIIVFTIARYGYGLSIPIERLLVFPLAVVPNVWGLWNILYRASNARQHVSLGVFGGALPLVLAPGGYLLTRLLAFPVPQVVFTFAPVVFPVGLIVYYLLWKHIVGFLNSELEIA